MWPEQRLAIPKVELLLCKWLLLMRWLCPPLQTSVFSLLHLGHNSHAVKLTSGHRVRLLVLSAWLLGLLAMLSTLSVIRMGITYSRSRWMCLIWGASCDSALGLLTFKDIFKI